MHVVPDSDYNKLFDVWRKEMASDSASSNMMMIDEAIEGKVDKEEGKQLSSNDFTNELKDKLDDLPANAEENQNAFSVVSYSGGSASATSKTGTLVVEAGSNVSIGASDNGTGIKISATDTTYSPATTSSNGLMSAGDKIKLSGIESEAQKNVQADFSEVDSEADSYIKNIPSWVKSNTKPTYTASEVEADAAGTAELAVASHDEDIDAHADLFEAKQPLMTEGTDYVGIDSNYQGKAVPDRISSPVVQVTANTTLALTHAGCMIIVNSTNARTITIPANSSVNFPIGTEIEIYRRGTGSVTIAGASGVTIECKESNMVITDRYTSVCVKQILSNIWTLQGNVG